MSGISPLAPEEASPEAQALLAPLRQASGRVLNVYGVLARAPAALEGFLALKRSLAGGVLSPELRERVAVLVAQLNGCEYCLSAHVGALRRLGLAEEELVATRRATSRDPKARAVLELTAALVDGLGSQADAFARARKEGVTEAEALEVAAHVALNVLTNQVNLLAQTQLDLPRVPLAL